MAATSYKAPRKTISNKNWIFIAINADNKKAGKWSEQKIIYGVSMTFIVEEIMDDGEPKMRASIRCDEDCPDKCWMVKAIIDVTHTKKHKDMEEQTLNAYFFNGNDSVFLYLDNWDFEEENLDELVRCEVNIDKNYSKMATLHLDTEIKIKFPKIDGANQEKSVMLNKFALASISSYFRNLFFGNSAECSADSTSFTIKEDADFDGNAFSLMIYLPLALGFTVHESKIFDNNLEMALKILKLSIKYDVQAMQQYCEKIFLDNDLEDCPKMELLEVADTLGLKELNEHVLDAITPMDVCEDIDRNVEIRARLSEQTRKELDNRLAMKKKSRGTEFKSMDNSKHRRRYPTPMPSPSRYRSPSPSF